MSSTSSTAAVAANRCSANRKYGVRLATVTNPSYIGPVTAQLYNTEILRLAAETAQAVRLPDPHASVEKRSAVCGSRVTVDIALGEDGRVAGVG